MYKPSQYRRPTYSHKQYSDDLEELAGLKQAIHDHTKGGITTSSVKFFKTRKKYLEEKIAKNEVGPRLHW